MNPETPTSDVGSGSYSDNDWVLQAQLGILEDLPVNPEFEDPEHESKRESDGGYSSPGRNEEETELPAWDSVLSKIGKDHPLLKPFQEAKRKQLLKEKDKLLLEIRQYELSKEDVKKETVVLGSQLFKLQQEATRAQFKLDQLKNDKETLKVSTHASESDLRKAKNRDEELQKEREELVEKEKYVIHELTKIDQQVAVLKMARTKCNGDVTALQNALSAAVMDKEKMEQDKELQNFQIERLAAFVRREQNTLEILQEATEKSTQLAAELAQDASQQEKELAAVEQESKAILASWKQNLLHVHKRSSNFADSLQTLESIRAEEAGYSKKLQNTRKEVLNSQLKHEEFSHRLLQLENNLLVKKEKVNMLKGQLLEEEEIQQSQNEVVEKLKIKHDDISKEYERKQNELEKLYLRLAQMTQRSRRLEDDELDKIGHQTTLSKETTNLKNKLKILKEKCRTMEDQLVNEEQKMNQTNLNLSNLKNDLYNYKDCLRSTQNKVSELEENAKKEEIDLKIKQEKIKTNANVLDRHKKKLEKLIAIEDGSEEPPYERKKRALQLDIKEMNSCRLQLEKDALILQKDVIQNQKKIEQLKEEKAKLQCEQRLYEERRRRLQTETNKEKSAYLEIQKTHKRLQKGISEVNNYLSIAKQQRDESVHLTGVSEKENSAHIKELEEELKEEDRILEELRMSIECIDEKLSEATDERSRLERSLETARKAKEEYIKEKGREGELSMMKKEINRMNVRWRALEANQKEMSMRLEKTVCVEEALKVRAKAALQKVERDSNSIKATREMQLDNLKRKYQNMQKVLMEIQKKIEETDASKKQVDEAIHLKEKLYNNNVRILQESANILEEKLTQKHEDQVQLQEERFRLRELTSLREGRYKALAGVSKDAQDQLQLSLENRISAYRRVLTQLLSAYPNLSRPLSAITKLLDHNSTKIY